MREPVKHVPHRVRDLPAEKVFAREWELLASVVADDHDFDLDDDAPKFTEGERIAAGHCRWLKVGQEEATLAASFITWLGTSVGRCFLEYGRKLEALMKTSQGSGMGIGDGSGFLAAWALQNARHIGMNHGWRTCEFLHSNWGEVKDSRITSEQLEVLENVARWLGSVDGIAFVERCEAMIFAKQKNLSYSDIERLAPLLPAVPRG